MENGCAGGGDTEAEQRPPEWQQQEHQQREQNEPDADAEAVEHQHAAEAAPADGHWRAREAIDLRGRVDGDASRFGDLREPLAVMVTTRVARLVRLVAR